MKMLSGSIILLAAAILWVPAIESTHKMDEAVIFAGPAALLGIIMIVMGLLDEKKG